MKQRVQRNVGSWLIVVLIVVCAGPVVGRAGDDWLSRPYVVDVAITPPNATTEQLVFDALGPACRRRSSANSEADKRLRVEIIVDGSKTTVTVNEDDLWLHDVGVTATLTVADPVLVPSMIGALSARVFRPRVRVVRREDTFYASVWGERLDPNLLKDRLWFRPALRFRDRDNHWRNTQPVNWTYLRLADPVPLGYEIVVESAFGVPLPGRMRRGDIVALAVPIVHEQTTYRLVDRASAHAKAGLLTRATAIASRNNASQNNADGPIDGTESTEVLEQLADRRGEIVIPAAFGELARLKVVSTSTLADVPVVVGATEFQPIPLAEDQERIELDERLASIESDLTDLMAQRAVLVAKIQSAADEEQWDVVDATLPKLDALPKATSLVGRLNAARVSAVDSATARGDRTLAARLRRQATRLEKTLKEFVDPGIDRQFRDELKALREIQKVKKELDPARKPTPSGSEESGSEENFAINLSQLPDSQLLTKPIRVIPSVGAKEK